MNNRLIRLRSLLLEVGNDVLRRVKNPAVFPSEGSSSEIITIADAEVSRDISLAKFYVSVMASPERKREIIEGLNHSKGFIRREFAKELCLKSVPEPIFILDETQERANRIYDLLDNLTYSAEVGTEEDE
ncbi:30S ribosome-binding factor RbfA [bacterium]|nr:30S ribosome-binding factor RbfA [bacterium]